MTESASSSAPAVPDAAAATRRIGIGLVVLIAVLLGLHLIGDRLTPYSNQARVHAFVVGISPEVTGRIERVHVRNDQLVKAGQPLFTLETDTFLIAAEKAEADIQATLREMKGQQAGVSVAEANLDIARATLMTAAQDAARYESIYSTDSGAISLRRLEVSRGQLAEARARVEAAKGQLQQARAARGETGDANDRLIAARTALARARIDLARTTVRAPGSGLITDLRADIGQVANAGSPVMTFISLNDGWVTADMTENNLGLMAIGNPVDVVFDVMPGTVLRGRVRSLGYGVESSGKGQPGALPDIQNNRDFLRQSQRFPVIVEFDHGVLASVNGLREGGQADVLVYTGDNPVMNALGWFYIRVMSWLAFAY